MKDMNETELRNLRFRVIQVLLEQDPKLAKMVKGSKLLTVNVSLCFDARRVVFN